VVAICRELDGLPLALELAAARTRLLGPTDLLSRLEEALEAGGARDLPERQRTMRGTLDWSHDLLSKTNRACS
jgi:predicted ATPase